MGFVEIVVLSSMERSQRLLLVSQWALVALCSSDCGCQKDFQRTR